MPCWTASSGTTVASFNVFTRSRVETDWPGHSAWFLLSNTAFRRIVPLVVSTWLLITASLPSASGFLPSVVIAITLSGAICLRLVDVGQLLFRRGEDHGDRLDLGDRDDAGLGRGIDDVADVDLAQAGDARRSATSTWV